MLKISADRINFWIKVAGIIFILLSLSRIPLFFFLPQWFARLGIDVITLEMVLGYFLIVRAYWARIFGLMVCAGAGFIYSGGQPGTSSCRGDQTSQDCRGGWLEFHGPSSEKSGGYD